MLLKELEDRLDKLEKEQERQQQEVTQLVTDIGPLKHFLKPQPKNGYVIRLDFGAGAPVSEWSDETNGWRSKDLGSRYSSQQQAEQKLTELKKKWPDYPLKINYYLQ
jgi:hypothetical protein